MKLDAPSLGILHVIRVVGYVFKYSLYYSHIIHTRTITIIEEIGIKKIVCHKIVVHQWRYTWSTLRCSKILGLVELFLEPYLKVMLNSYP